MGREAFTGHRSPFTACMLTINVVTLFREALAPLLEASILGRAAREGLVRYRLVNRLRAVLNDVNIYTFGSVILNRE